MQPPKKFNPDPFPYHYEVEFTVDTLTNRGLGRGRIDGWVVMVPFVFPGEHVKARVYRNYQNYSEAALVEVLKPSPNRIEPQCPLFGTCGGCQYQNFQYEQQLFWKAKHVEEAFLQISNITFPVNKTYPSPNIYHYRSKITPHFPKPKEEKPRPIGFLKQGTRSRIVDVPQCPIATEEINKALPVEREKILSGERKFKKGGTLLLRHTLEGVTTDHQDLVSERVGDIIFQFKAGDFFQNNPFILPHLVNYVIDQAKDPEVHYLIDTYCGIGLFALSAAKHFEQVAGVEVNPSAIEWANGNAKINNIENCEFLIGQAESIFSEISFSPKKTTIIIDPPRKGCGEQFIRQLMAFVPKKIVYISCDPATQARDLKFFLNSGYVLSEIQPFDLFPQTRHIENVITLTSS